MCRVVEIFDNADFNQLETYCKDLTCQKVDLFDSDGYCIAMEKYHAEMNEYKKKNWFIRLFTEKPVEPNIKYFYRF